MIRSVALLLTALTGFSGLVYEVTWQKYLATLLGSHSEATAAVLALFLGGLSVGYSLFGRVSRKLAESGSPERVRGRLLRVYGLVELGIGLYAFVFPLAFAAARGLSLWVPRRAAGDRLRLRRAALRAPDRAARDPDGRDDSHADPGAGPGARGRDPLPRPRLRAQHGGRLRRRPGCGVLAGAPARTGGRADRDGSGERGGGARLPPARPARPARGGARLRETPKRSRPSRASAPTPPWRSWSASP